MCKYIPVKLRLGFHQLRSVIQECIMLDQVLVVVQLQSSVSTYGPATPIERNAKATSLYWVPITSSLPTTSGESEREVAFRSGSVAI